jgi:hypothetical protein
MNIILIDGKIHVEEEKIQHILMKSSINMMVIINLIEQIISIQILVYLVQRITKEILKYRLIL